MSKELKKIFNLDNQDDNNDQRIVKT